MIRRVRSITSVLVALAFTAPCLAEPSAGEPGTARAATLDAEAREAFEASDFAEAARLFDAAFEARAHGKTKLNAGIAHDSAGNRELAADAYEGALSRSFELSQEDLAAVRDRIAVLRPQLGYVRVAEPAGATVLVGTRRLAIPAQFHLLPGTHTLTIVTQSDRIERRVDARAGETVELSIDIRPPRPERPVPRVPERQVPERRVPVDRGEPSAGHGAWPWIAIGSATALAAAGVAFGLATNSAIDDFEATGRTDPDQRDRAVLFRAISVGSFSAAAVSAVVGVVLLLDESGPTRSGMGRRAHPPGVWVF